MKIVVEELYSTIEQAFNNKVKRRISTIRPWIYKHLSPVGDFYLTVTQNSQTIATSEIVTSLTIENNSDATALNYFHGVVSFNFEHPFVLQLGNFEIQLNGSGYTFSESAYIGWVKPHDNKYIVDDFTAGGDFRGSLGLEIWEYRNRI